jgi:uncharacterized protein (TIGR03435 family)
MRHLSRKVVLVVTAAAVAVMPLASQTPPAQKRSFEVTSVKQSRQDARGGGFNMRGDRFVATNTTVKALLQFAYFRPNNPLLNYQIVGSPNWIGTDRFDIEAKAEINDQQIPTEQVRSMLQSLLEDRFQLKARYETRDLPVYILTVGRDGPRLKLSEDQTPPAPVTGPGPPQRPGEAPVLPRGVFSVMPRPSGMALTGTAIPFSNIVAFLQARVQQRIFDKTELKGLFDIRLEFADALSANSAAMSSTGGPTPPQEPSPPSLAVALDDLGLKLESAKAPLEVLVIDSVQKPSGN